MTTIRSEDTDAVLQRVAYLAFLYYPEVQVHEPDYSLSDDIAFCLEPLGVLDGFDPEMLTDLRELIGYTIVDPTEHRQEMFAVLTDLTQSVPAEQ